MPSGISQCEFRATAIFNFQKIPLFASRRQVSTKFSTHNQELIYSGPLSRKMRFIKGFTLFTSCTNIPIQIGLLMVNEEVASNVGYQIFLMACVAIQTFLPFAIHFVAKRYVIRMYYNSVTDKYTAVTYGFIPTEKYVSNPRRCWNASKTRYIS
jgi:hypothetical protein